MAKGSKKGACSAHIDAAKANCLEHNRRDYSEKNRPKYIMCSRSGDNRTVFEHEDIKGRKSIVPLVRKAEKLYSEKTGQRCQKSFAPYREDVLSFPGRSDISDEQLMNYKEMMETETGWTCMGIWYHKDEGYQKSKHIEGEDGEAINYHVHVLWYCQDPDTGKARRNDRKFFSLRQDWLAAATGMERGNPKGESGVLRRSAQEERIERKEERINNLDKVLKRQEENSENLKAILADQRASIEENSRIIKDQKAEIRNLSAEYDSMGAAIVEHRQSDAEKWKARFASAWDGAIEAIDAIIARIRTSWQRSFTTDQAQAIDHALPEDDIEARQKYADELMDMVREDLPAGTNKAWIKDAEKDVNTIAQKDWDSLRLIQSQGISR